MERAGGTAAPDRMRRRVDVSWEQLAERQAGMLSRRQLNACGVDRFLVRNRVSAGRWVPVGPMVVATVTGELGWDQRLWAAHLHAGPSSVVAGLAALRCHGLRGWDRQTVEVLLPCRSEVAPLAGARFVRTRRDLGLLRGRGIRSHLLQVEPAVLLRAADEPHARTACGLVAASVQQRLTRADRLLTWLPLLQPLPRAALLRAVLSDIAGGAESMAEIDLGAVCRRSGLAPPTRQCRRRDRSGRVRYADAEWELPDGRTLVLEVDGAFHMEVAQWTADLARQRSVTTPTRTVVRCTALELRLDPDSVVAYLRALGVPSGVVRVRVRRSAR